jgi:hypothetical protein
LGIEKEYDRLAVDVRGVQSGVVGAYTYKIPQLTHGLLPSRRYLGLLCDGARAAGLPSTRSAAGPRRRSPARSTGSRRAPGAEDSSGSATTCASSSRASRLRAARKGPHEA